MVFGFRVQAQGLRLMALGFRSLGFRVSSFRKKYLKLGFLEAFL